MALFTEMQYLCTFNIVAPPPFAKCLEGIIHISASIFVDVLYWPPYSMDKFISCVVLRPLQWFFHFGEEIVITRTQEKTTILGGTEPHHSSWQCKESHCCCHGCLAPFSMGDSGTSIVLTQYESMWLRFFAKVKEPLRGTQYNTRDELILAIGNSN